MRCITTLPQCAYSRRNILKRITRALPLSLSSSRSFFLFFWSLIICLSLKMSCRKSHGNLERFREMFSFDFKSVQFSPHDINRHFSWCFSIVNDKFGLEYLCTLLLKYFVSWTTMKRKCHGWGLFKMAATVTHSHFSLGFLFVFSSESNISFCLSDSIISGKSS